MNLILTRGPPADNCTLGKLTVESFSWYTMERPWIPDPSGGIGGTPDISCVPPGVYQLVLHDTHEHPKTWALVNPELGVWHEPENIPTGITNGRYACLLHPGNWSWDLLGCIAPGMGCQQNGQTYMVTNSVEAMTELQNAVPWVEGHTITIVEAA